MKIDKLLLASVSLDTYLLFKILKKLKKIMATQKRFEESFAKIDTVTTQMGEALTDVAGDLKKLREDLANSGLSAAKEEELAALLEEKTARIEQIAAGLTEMAKDPENPVPEPEPKDTEGEITENDPGTEGEQVV